MVARVTTHENVLDPMFDATTIPLLVEAIKKIEQIVKSGEVKNINRIKNEKFYIVDQQEFDDMVNESFCMFYE